METQPFTFLAKLCPQGTQAVHQPDGLIQFDFLTHIYSSFLESLFHWGLPEKSRWCVHARVHVGLWAGRAASQPLVFPRALQRAVPALCIHTARAAGISAFTE